MEVRETWDDLGLGPRAVFMAVDLEWDDDAVQLAWYVLEVV
jgi:hypothetical protein